MARIAGIAPFVFFVAFLPAWTGCGDSQSAPPAGQSAAIPPNTPRRRGASFGTRSICGARKRAMVTRRFLSSRKTAKACGGSNMNSN